MEAILDKALREAGECEVFGVSQTDTSMSFEANRLKMVDTREASGLALRLVKDGRIGFSSHNQPRRGGRSGGQGVGDGALWP